MVLSSAGNVTLFSFAHPSKVYAFIVVSPSGSTISRRLTHSEKALSPRYFSPTGNVTLLSMMHHLKAELPILVVEGIVIACKFLQSWKAEFPMSVSFSGSVISRRLSHPAKASESIYFSSAGNVTLLSMVHPLKADLPIVSVVEGIVIACKFLQSWKADLPIDLIPSCKTISPMAE